MSVVTVPPIDPAALPPIPDSRPINRWRDRVQRLGADQAGPAPEEFRAGPYQHVLLDTRSGELSFHCGDWRNTDHAWVASTAALFELPGIVPATAGSDASDARWWPLRDLDQLTAVLADAGGLYEPHRPLLARALERLRNRQGAAAGEVA